MNPYLRVLFERQAADRQIDLERRKDFERRLERRHRETLFMQVIVGLLAAMIGCLLAFAFQNSV